ncbi:restriction endonuclease subunit S [Sediminibacterium sp. C3]|uniref:restriction endonuclease subunit S n=1 Tax=Sediminibacterium sp. C3 TaxID=1267211 RepID=UPI000423A763|nr:restriction endonuclease subunit S [Sediminibacterium sp. C3]
MIAQGIRFKYIQKDIRLNGGYYLNEDALNSLLLEENRDKCVQLNTIANVWNPPIFKRQFCQKTENALPYCQSSDVSNILEGSNVYVNKRQAISVGSVVAENQILVTGFGTIGNTRLVNELSAGISYANNVCRIQANAGFPYGYLYAFLSSKYGKSQLNKNASGSVVRYIEAPEIKKTLIPILQESKQQQIHDLIVEVSKLRVDANKLLKEAIVLLNKKLPYYEQSKKTMTGKSSIKEIFHNYQQRIDSPTFVNPAVIQQKKLQLSGIPFQTIRECGFQVTRPGIFKRIKVLSTSGLPYIKGSELNKLNPFGSCEYLSKNKTPFLDELQLKEDQILFTCAGTIGDLKLISKEFEEMKAIGSQDIIRIEEKSSNLPIYYLFAYLQTPIMQDYIQSLKYGSVIERVEPFHVDLIPVLIPDTDLKESICERVILYKSKNYEAFKLEQKAISLVEKHIETWQE